MIKPSNDQSEADWIQISSNFRALRGAGRWCVNPRSVLCGVGPTCEDWASSPEPPPRAQKAGVRQSGGVPWKAAADSSLQACITAPQAHLSCYPWARSQWSPVLLYTRFSCGVVGHSPPSETPRIPSFMAAVYKLLWRGDSIVPVKAGNRRKQGNCTAIYKNRCQLNNRWAGIPGQTWGAQQLQSQGVGGWPLSDDLPSVLEDNGMWTSWVSRVTWLELFPTPSFHAPSLAWVCQQAYFSDPSWRALWKWEAGPALLAPFSLEVLVAGRLQSSESVSSVRETGHDGWWGKRLDHTMGLRVFSLSCIYIYIYFFFFLIEF